MLYTLSLALVGMLLITLTLLLVHHAATAETRTAALSFAHTMYDQQSSAQQLLAEALLRQSQLSVSSNNNSFTVMENLPAGLAAMDDLLNRLKSDVEQDFPALNVSLALFQNNHALQLVPINITYAHPDGNTIRVTASQNSSITAYALLLNFAGANITACSNSILSGGSVAFNFTALGVGQPCSLVQSNVQQAHLDITVGGNGVSVDLDHNQRLLLKSNASAKSTLAVGFLPGNATNYLEVPILLTIDKPSHNFSQASVVQLPFNN